MSVGKRSFKNLFFQDDDDDEEDDVDADADADVDVDVNNDDDDGDDAGLKIASARVNVDRPTLMKRLVIRTNYKW